MSPFLIIVALICIIVQCASAWNFETLENMRQVRYSNIEPDNDEKAITTVG